MMTGKAGKTINVALIFNYLINMCYEVWCILIITYVIILVFYR